MTTYKHSSELEGKTLEYGDNVFFDGILEGGVRDSFIDISDFYNGYPFDVLELNKVAFCNEHYGYESEGGDWPETKGTDYAALTRAVLALMKIFEEKKPFGTFKNMFLKEFPSFKIFSHGETTKFYSIESLKGLNERTLEEYSYDVYHKNSGVYIFAPSLENFLENIEGFGEKCAWYSKVSIFSETEFQLCAVGDPYLIYLKKCSIQPFEYLNRILFETKNGCKIMFLVYADGGIHLSLR